MKPNSYINSVRTNSVSSPSAQSFGVLQSNGNLDELESTYRLWSERNNIYPVAVKAIIGLLFSGNLRISEVLAIRAQDIMHDGRIFVKAKKGSFDRVVFASYYTDWWISNRLKIESILKSYSRFFIYRVMLKYGMYIKQAHQKTKRVCHAPRTVKAQEMVKSNVPRETVSRELGHKSTKSLGYYVK